MKSTEIINIAFEHSGLKTKEASDLIGFKSRNHFSSIKSGNERLPKSKILSTSRVLGIDHKELTLALMEDSIDTEDYDILRIYYEFINQQLLTSNEIDLINYIRKLSKELNPNILENSKSPDWSSSNIIKTALQQLCEKLLQQRAEILEKIKKQASKREKIIQVIKSLIFPFQRMLHCNQPFLDFELRNIRQIKFNLIHIGF